MASKIINVTLTILATVGALFVAVAVSFFLLGYSIILFSTGSMAPTIEPGALSIVKTIPAAEIEVGDILTVDRPDKLPVTHRVISVNPGASHDERLIRMQGDANDYPDAEEYVIAEGRIEVVTIPSLAVPFQFVFWNPLIASLLFLALGGLTTWAFWPKKAGTPPEADEPTTPDHADDHSGQGADQDKPSEPLELTELVAVGSSDQA